MTKQSKLVLAGLLDLGRSFFFPPTFDIKLGLGQICVRYVRNDDWGLIPKNMIGND